MTNLPELFNEAYADVSSVLASRYPVPPMEQIYVLYNQNIGSAWGYACKWISGNYTRLIKLSKTLCAYTNKNAILNTMVHEIIHCCGIWNHRRDFKLAAKIVNSAFPEKYHVTRCTSPNEKMTVDQINQAYKHVLECPVCHKKWGYKRTTKWVLRYNECFCKSCSTKEKKVYLIKVK